jgi:hypothetical protein
MAHHGRYRRRLTAPRDTIRVAKRRRTRLREIDPAQFDAIWANLGQVRQYEPGCDFFSAGDWTLPEIPAEDFADTINRLGLTFYSFTQGGFLQYGAAPRDQSP